jgi:hypothetical protein
MLSKNAPRKLKLYFTFCLLGFAAKIYAESWSTAFFVVVVLARLLFFKLFIF